MIQLDARLSAIADMVAEAIEGRENPCFADIGCDHGFLTAHLLMRFPSLRAVASDISAPSLEKARKLLEKEKLSDRAQFAVADGLGAINRPVDAIVAAGMGAQTILKIVGEGLSRIGQAALIVQANVDLPMLRSGLAALGFAVEKEAYTLAAGRHYVTMLARPAQVQTLGEREALLGTAAHGVTEETQRGYYLWQRGVRVREMEKNALIDREQENERRAKTSRELSMMAQALCEKTCTVAELEGMVNGIAPFSLAEEWDNVGLLLGRRGAAVDRVLVALDVTRRVLDEAQALGAQAIVTHHPMMLSARRRMTDEDREGSLMLRMAQCGIAHIAAHTNLDAAPGGVNDVLMERMGAQNVTGEGCIRIGDLPQGMTLEQLLSRAEKSLKTRARVYGAMDTPVHRLGCCSGSGSSAIAEAVALGADCFITGEVKHHLALEAMDMGCCVIEAGHYETENPVCEVLASALQNAADELKYNVTVFCSKVHPFER